MSLQSKKTLRFCEYEYEDEDEDEDAEPPVILGPVELAADDATDGDGSPWVRRSPRARPEDPVSVAALCLSLLCLSLGLLVLLSGG